MSYGMLHHSNPYMDERADEPTKQVQTSTNLSGGEKQPCKHGAENAKDGLNRAIVRSDNASPPAQNFPTVEEQLQYWRDKDYELEAGHLFLPRQDTDLRKKACMTTETKRNL